MNGFTDLLNQATGFMTGPGQIILTLGWSWLLKNKTSFANRLIPALNLGIGAALAIAHFGTAALAGAEVAPVGFVAQAAVYAVPAAAGGTLLLFWNIVQAITNSLIATGIHSTTKNLRQVAGGS